MKILRLTTLLDFGGQERKYISFTENKKLLQNKYVFAAIGYGGNAENILRDRGFEVHVLNRNFSIRNLTNIWTVYKLIKKVKPDVIHTAAAEANFHGIIAARLAGVKYIIGEEIGIPNHSKIAQSVFSYVYRLSDKVICVSKAVKNYLVKIGEIPHSKGVIVYNPAKVSNFLASSIDSDVFKIIYVGRLEKVKNVDFLLNGLSKVKNRRIKLQIVGDGRERKNLENLSKELGISKIVEFLGFSKEPSKYLSGANLFVLPSFSEGFGIAVVEAMLLKIPVFCSEVGGIPEFVVDKQTGWLFSPIELDEFVRKLDYIISLPKSDLKKIGDSGFEYVENRFTIEKYVENLENLYERVEQ